MSRGECLKNDSFDIAGSGFFGIVMQDKGRHALPFAGWGGPRFAPEGLKRPVTFFSFQPPIPDAVVRWFPISPEMDLFLDAAFGIEEEWTKAALQFRRVNVLGNCDGQALYAAISMRIADKQKWKICKVRR